MARIAIVSDIHGNRTAFDAVLADLRRMSPDLVLHGGDLADSGSSPVEIVDRIRDLGWPGVFGNTDEMLFRPESLAEFANQSPHLKPLLAIVEEMAEAAREALGEERVAWMGSLPRTWANDDLVLVHAAPDTPWRAPGPDAGDAELQAVYGAAGRRVAVYGHIHCPYVRTLSGLTVANSGSAGMPYDGDRRAAYLLLDNRQVTIRRVDYDVEREVAALSASPLPHAEWLARILETGRPAAP